VKKILLSILLILTANLAQAAETKRLCVFDPLGANGDAFNLLKDYAIDMAVTGIKLSLSPYTDESVAVADFISGKCDIVAATDIRLRPFSKFGGTVSAVGAIPDPEELRTLIRALNRPKAQAYLDDGKFALLGLIPMGAGYLFVNDRSIDTVGELAGKRIATLDYQKDAIHMVNHVGATVVPSDVTDFGGKFNNGSVDICYAPALAYNAYELYKGLGEKGGVIRYPLAQLTLQLIARSSDFDDEFKQLSRVNAEKLFDKAFKLIKQHEDSIDPKYWVDISLEDIAGYQEMFRQNRIELRENGTYDPTMLTIMRQIRCMSNRAASECSADDRE